MLMRVVQNCNSYSVCIAYLTFSKIPVEDPYLYDVHRQRLFEFLHAILGFQISKEN